MLFILRDARGQIEELSEGIIDPFLVFIRIEGHLMWNLQAITFIHKLFRNRSTLCLRAAFD